MREIRLSVVNFSWDRSFYFDDLSELRIGLLKKIVLQEPTFSGYPHIVAFYKSSQIPDDGITLINMVDSDSPDCIVISFLLLDHSTAAPLIAPSTPSLSSADQAACGGMDKLTQLKIDPASIVAASNWVLNHASGSTAVQQQYRAITIGKMLSALTRSSDCAVSNSTASSSSTISSNSSRHISTNLGNTEDNGAGPGGNNDNDTDVDGNGNMEHNNNEINNNNNNNNNLANRRNVFVLPRVQWLQWSLIVKLVLTCVLFTYNRRVDFHRCVSVIGVAVIVYFVQIGAFSYWFKILCAYFNVGVGMVMAGGGNQPAEGEDVLAAAGAAAHANGNQLQQQQHQQQQPRAAAGPHGNINAPHNDANHNHAAQHVPAGAAGAAGAAQALGIAGYQNAVLEFLWESSRNGVAVPTTPGLLLDVMSFFMSFALSLLPNWNPTPRPF